MCFSVSGFTSFKARSSVTIRITFGGFGSLAALLGLLALRRREAGGERAGRSQPEERVDRYEKYPFRLDLLLYFV